MARRVLTQAELEAAHCWEAGDRVPGRPEMTEYRRQVRYHQAQWREANGLPIGSQPMVPKRGAAARRVGNRLPLEYARETGATFVTANARAAANARLMTREPHQSLDTQRTWAELMWSLSLAFNLFGDLAADHARADRAVHMWWRDAPGTVSDVRFAHSPGWLDPDFLGNLSDFDAAVTLDRGDDTRGILAIRTPYYDWTKPETPKPTRLDWYRTIMKRSRAFQPPAIDAVNGTDLTVLWLGHLLMLSMLQHPSGAWHWGRFVVVHPAGNVDFADACARYRNLLVDESTFASITLEDLLASAALPRKTAVAVHKRYIPR